MGQYDFHSKRSYRNHLSGYFLNLCIVRVPPSLSMSSSTTITTTSSTTTTTKSLTTEQEQLAEQLMVGLDACTKGEKELCHFLTLKNSFVSSLLKDIDFLVHCLGVETGVCSSFKIPQRINALVLLANNLVSSSHDCQLSYHFYEFLLRDDVINPDEDPYNWARTRMNRGANFWYQHYLSPQKRRTGSFFALPCALKEKNKSRSYLTIVCDNQVSCTHNRGVEKL